MISQGLSNNCKLSGFLEVKCNEMRSGLRCLQAFILKFQKFLFTSAFSHSMTGFRHLKALGELWVLETHQNKPVDDLSPESL